MATKKKTAAKKTTKNSSHLRKRDAVAELRWAVVYDGLYVTVMGPGASRRMARGWAGPGDHVIRVRITEVSK